MPKVNFKSYLTPARERLPSDLEIVVATYGPFLTVEETAACLKKHRKTIETLIKTGKLKAGHNGPRGAYIISATAIVKFVRGLNNPASPGRYGPA